MTIIVHSNCHHLIDILTKFYQNHIPPALLNRPDVRCLSIFTKIAMYSCAHVAHSRKIPINPSLRKLNSLKKCSFTASSFYKQTCEYSCSKGLMSHNINLLSYHFTISYALHSCETINRKVNCGLTPRRYASPSMFRSSLGRTTFGSTATPVH